MTTPPIFTQLTNAARQCAQQYKALYDNVFNNVNGTSAVVIVTEWTTNAGKYFTAMNDLKTMANDQDETIIPTLYQTYPNTVVINQDGTVTLS